MFQKKEAFVSDALIKITRQFLVGCNGRIWIQEKEAFKIKKHSRYLHYGRIWILWNPVKVRVTCLQKSDQYIHCQVVQLDTNIAFLATVIYGYNTRAERGGFETDWCGYKLPLAHHW